MSENASSNVGENNAKVQVPPRKLQPILFIGLGGTGMEVILRIRRRILHATWGKQQDVRIGSLDEFPVAEFLHFDLDHGAVLESGRANNTDSLAALVKLSPQDRLISGLDLMKYMRTDDDIQRYPHIASWFPLRGEKIRNLDVSKGAGQLRAISRLYFFDTYRTVRDAIHQKLQNLQNNLGHTTKLDSLGLKVDGDRVKIVVIGSVAGGTGSGAFLDMGWLAKQIAYKVFRGNGYEVQLMLFTPRGYGMANKERTQANGYAAFMELESCMRKMRGYVDVWSPDEGHPELEPTPYSDVYILETGNMRGDGLGEIQHVYEMAADALFEDFASEEFANKKRSIAVNKEIHKGTPYTPPLTKDYAGMNLVYYMGYSSFGQSILDTKYSQQQDQEEYRYASAMLETFFGIASKDETSLRATDKDRKEFIENHLDMPPILYDSFPEFSDKSEFKKLCSAFYDNKLTKELLKDEQGNIEQALKEKVTTVIERIKGDSANVKEWDRLVRDQISPLKSDVIHDVNSSGNTSDHRVARRRILVVEEKIQIFKRVLYKYLDDRDKGGLEFVLSLIEMVKTEFERIAAQLLVNADRYTAISDGVMADLVEYQLGNLAAASKGGLFSGPDVKKATEYIGHISKDLGEYLALHLRSTAARNAAGVMQDLNEFLGGSTGQVDAQGTTLYYGLVEEFQEGRRAVLDLSNEILKTTEAIEDSKDKVHANYIFINSEQVKPRDPDRKALRDWAEDAFKDFDGSKKIFPMLKTPEGKVKLLSRLRSRASRARISLYGEKEEQSDPLLKSLLQLDPVQRKEIFDRFMRRAMPWIDSSFADVPLNADRFTCLIGVMRKEDWEVLRGELDECTPTTIGITASQVQFCTTGIPGRAVCYCELSGFPLRVLKGLENWRQSYRIQNKELPTHTHIDATGFVHPMVPTTEELRSMASDFRLFLLATMLRKLVRSTDKVIIPSGQYRFDFGRGDWRDFGNERSFRRDGLQPPAYRSKLESTVNESLDEFSPLQLFALSRLAEYTARETYAPRLERGESGTEVPRPGFAYNISDKLSKELTNRAYTQGLAEGKDRQGLAAMEQRVSQGIATWGENWMDLTTSFEQWTEVIPNSDEDAYEWERRDPEPGASDRCKRRLRKEFFNEGWLENLVGMPDGNTTTTTTEVVTPTTNSKPPIPTGLNGPWWFGINGKKVGPCNDKQVMDLINDGTVTADTKAWKKGMASWVISCEIPELSDLLVTPPDLDEDLPPDLN